MMWSGNVYVMGFSISVVMVIEMLEQMYHTGTPAQKCSLHTLLSLVKQPIQAA